MTDDFIAWLKQQDFSAAFPDEESKKDEQKKKCLAHYENTLMCGLVALNHILGALKLPPVTATYMHQVAQEMADREVALLYGSSKAMVLDLEADPRGNYAVDVLLHTLAEKTSQQVERWKTDAPIKSSILLVGNGQHWQAVLRDKEGHWYVFEKHSAKAIQNLLSFLKRRTKHGTAYVVGAHDQLPNGAYFQRFISQSEKTGSDKNEPP